MAYIHDGNYQLKINSDGSINNQNVGGSSLSSGLISVTTAGTRVQLPNTPCKEVTIVARRGNTGYLYVGGSLVSATSYGAELSAKDSITLSVSNLNLIYIDSSVSGEGISYISTN